MNTPSQSHHRFSFEASEWAPYISCFSRVKEMHSTKLWSDEELEMIKKSLLYDATLDQKAYIEKIYLSIKHVLDHFLEYFEDVTLDKFKHAYNLVYCSEKLCSWREYDTVLVEINVPPHDHLREMKLDLLDRHSIQARMRIKKSHYCGNYFIAENVESSCVKGSGISIPLRAFSRVVCCTSPQVAAAREMEAHRFLHLKFDDMIENHTAALESLTLAASPTLSGKRPRRMQLARDFLSQDLQILRSNSAWLKNYCEALKV
uniref:Uncharacterized protein n=1 Tax=Tanacetum cinerariifolium TaxID=118510 RepID=A0A6L2N4P6_TANCI|nr:hypothetical protein [Tanacetum cinerariifolium]